MTSRTDQESGNSLAHHFLLAMPGMRDPFFAHSLTYLIEHGRDGAMGLVVNHSSPLTLQDVAAQLGITACEPAAARLPIHIGGPVDIQRGFILHAPGRSWPGTVRVGEDLALSTCRDIVVDIAAGQGPHDCLLVLGYCGWAAGQLEQELADNSWLTLPADPRILFGFPPEARAQQAALALGIRLDRLSAEAGHA